MGVGIAQQNAAALAEVPSDASYFRIESRVLSADNQRAFCVPFLIFLVRSPKRPGGLHLGARMIHIATLQFDDHIRDFRMRHYKVGCMFADWRKTSVHADFSNSFPAQIQENRALSRSGIMYSNA
jgi:hypothetical protein